MKLPVVSGGDAVKAFRKLGYELDEQHGATSFFDTPILPTGASRFRITKNSPEDSSGVDSRGWAHGGGVHDTALASRPVLGLTCAA